MRFEEVYEAWRERRLSQSEAAEILGVCERSFRRYSARYEDSEGDLGSLADKRLSQVSKRKAAATEIDALIALFQSRYIGWHFRAATSGQPISLKVLSAASNQFGVSLTAAALQWIKSTEESAVLVLSRDGYIDWSISSDRAFKVSAQPTHLDRSPAAMVKMGLLGAYVVDSCGGNTGMAR